MNYYEHHLGDYAKDTTSLTMLEEGAYRRLIDVYYAKELPLPADITKVCKAARAMSRPEKEAVQSVLGEFFTLTPDGYRHKRCDQEIERYQASQEGAEDKRENDKERQRRARERRKDLFEQLRGHGIVPPWDAKTHELEAHLSRVTKPPPSVSVTRDESPPVTRDNTATQEPDTSPQSPEYQDKGAGTREVVPRTPGADACLRMKAAGLQGVNPSHPKLLALLDAGITVDELAHAAGEAAAKGKNFAYALATAEGRRRDAATPALPDRASITVPGPSGPDPTLARLDADRAAWKPPAPEVKAMLAQTVARLKGAAS